MEPSITVENLSKRYRLGTLRGHQSLRDSIAASVRAPLHRLRNGKTNSKETIWALRDVSFKVAPGEVIGIIGRNGAGKSTLLKILARITKPTKGHVELRGRVGSLLEVGTGFHSELTGRENIFLNGAILGMSKREIEAKFDEIVAFAETEAFLDTPVKRYSSGMIVRLAFAVAAHLEPEILIIDEVLAVGDFAFQKKCLGKMNEVAKHGRTVLFVSHDISAVNALCQRVILLNEGSILKSGPTEEVTRYYLDSANKLYSPINWVPVDNATGGEIELNSVAVEQAGEATSVVSCRDPFSLKLEYDVKRAIRGSRFFLILRNSKGELVFTTSDYDIPTPEAITRQTGRFVSKIEVPGGLLKTGSYLGTIGVDIANDRVVFAADDALQFDVFEPKDDTQAERHNRVGVIAPLLEWETTRTGN
ncbi:MAG TPA: ABC transporter ATP-binding protein [Pyrinomonadaceae bacterium]|nr:ABC transporter ATP-binding protein [Pyrinomonadaceae bacterium]